jgi:hypothetical protein
MRFRVAPANERSLAGVPREVSILDQYFCYRLGLLLDSSKTELVRHLSQFFWIQVGSDLSGAQYVEAFLA